MALEMMAQNGKLIIFVNMSITFKLKQRINRKMAQKKKSSQGTLTFGQKNAKQYQARNLLFKCLAV